MGNRYKDTTMGGAKGAFQKTLWSDIEDAKTLNETRRRAIIDKLIKMYWKPVYCYLRRKGYANEPAKDLTQGFFHEIVLGHKLIQQADETKGKFRTFLLTALERYVVSVHRKESAKKRMPSEGIIEIEAVDFPDFLGARSKVNPECAFSYALVADLLDQVLERVKDECYNTGKATHWEVFSAKILDPIFDNVSSPPLAVICTKYRVENEVKASNMIVTVKRRFRLVLKNRLRQFVSSDSQVDEEFSDLVKILSGFDAG